MISVIIPAFNASAHIRQAISCITGQTYNNLEIIVVNDGSSDNTEDIVREISLQDSRVKLFTTPNNGSYEARRYGISQAKGEWIAFSDSDDTMPSDAISNLAKNRCDRHDIIVGNLNVNNEYLFNHKVTGTISNIRYCRAILDGDTSIGNYGKLFRARLFNGLKPLPRRIKQNEDMLMLLHAAKNASDVFVTNDINVYNYIFHKGSISKGPSMPLADWLLLFDLIRESLSGIYTAELHKAFTVMRLNRLYENVVLRGTAINPAEPCISEIIRDCEKAGQLPSATRKHLETIKSPISQKIRSTVHRTTTTLKDCIKIILRVNR